MAESRKQLWQVPAYGSPKEDVLTFLKQQVDDGQRYYFSSPAYQQLEESIRIISGGSSPRLAEKQKDDRYSKVHTNRLKRNLREMVNSLADIRFTPGFHADANEYQDLAETLNRVGASWYADRFIDVQIKKSIQWMAITTCCYMELQYRRLPGERDKCEIDLIPHSAFDVTMTGVPESGDLQETYVVTIIRDLPVYLAHATWPAFQDDLQPDRESPKGWTEKIISVMQDVFSDQPKYQTAKNPTVRMYYQYVMDLSINKTQAPVTMGLDPNTGEKSAWTYVVPYLGQMILAGYDQQGVEQYRKATVKDCRMFPGRRLLVGTESKCIYDGPSWDMHGKVPLVKMSSDSWPFADYSMIHDVANVQDAVGEMERMIHQTSRNKSNPSILYNMRSMDRNKAKAFRTEVTGQRIGYNGNEGNDPAKPALPASFYEVQEWQPGFVKYLEEQMDYQMGVGNFQALAKMKQGGSAESLDAAMEKAGPIVKGIARDMERAMRDIAEMFKFMVLQYYTTPKIKQVVGLDGITPVNFDFDPGNLIPAHLPGETISKPSIHSQMERARYVAEHVTFFITPNTLHQITQMQQKLLYLQLWRGGFPIDPWTLAEIFNIGNFGKVPDGCNSILDRYMAWQKMQLEFKAQLEEEAGAMQGGLQSNTPGTGPSGGQKGTGGRAPSGQTAPHMSPPTAQRGGRVRETR
jgi:hypothetical protein